MSESEQAPTEPLLDLEKEWVKQAQKLARLFAGELGITRKEYVATLPRFKPQPEGFKGRFDIPAIVEARIPLGRLLQRARISCDYYPEEVQDWQQGGFVTPKDPYTAWLNAIKSDRSITEVRMHLAKDERCGTVFDGVALYLRDPSVLRRGGLQLPGSELSLDHVGPEVRLIYDLGLFNIASLRARQIPTLMLWKGQPNLTAVTLDDPPSREMRLVVCGRS